MSLTASIVSLITGLSYAVRFLALREEIKLRTLLTTELDANEKRSNELRENIIKLRSANRDADADRMLHLEAKNAALRNRLTARLSLLEEWADGFDKSGSAQSDRRTEVGKPATDEGKGRVDSSA
jgi:hypothetical protein